MGGHPSPVTHPVTPVPLRGIPTIKSFLDNVTTHPVTLTKKLSIALLLILPLTLSASWEILDMPTDRGFDAICSINEENIFVIGHQGLWKTFNGLDWTLDTGYHASSLLFVDDTLGLIGGYYITTDGGRTWHKGDTVNGGASSVSFPKNQSLIGYGCGYDVIRKTEDGGWHWNTLPDFPDVYPSSQEYIYPNKICFPNNPDTGYVTATCEEWISEDNVIPHYSYFKTTDGGQTWVINVKVLYDDNFIPIHVCFPETPQIGYMAGAGKIYKTTDGGESWEMVLQTPSDYTNIYDIYFPETDQVGYILNDTMIHKTTDGGETWHTFGLGQDTVFLRCHFLNNQLGFISGTGTTAYNTLNPYTPGFVMKTTDGLLGIAEDQWVDVGAEGIQVSAPGLMTDRMRMQYSITQPGDIKINIFDASGRRVDETIHKRLGQSSGWLDVNAAGLVPGVYFVRVGFSSSQSKVTKTLRTVKVQ